MRALRRLARPAVATAAAVLLLSGCGGDDGNDSSSSSPSSSSSSSSSPSTSSSGGSSESGGGSADPAVAAFCEDAQVFATAAQELGNLSDPAQLAPQLAEASAAFDATQPPEEIAEDWGVLGDALRNWADVGATADLTTPDGQAQFQAATDEFVSTFSGPEGQNVDAFVTANCPGA